MKPIKTLLVAFCLITISGCYPKVDPSLLYIGSVEASPDTLTEAGRAINENIATNLKNRFDSSYIDYNIASHPVVYPKYYGGFYLNGRVKPVFIVVGDTAIARADMSKRMENNDFLLKQGEYSSHELDSILNIINSKISDRTLNMYSAGVSTPINRIIVGLDKCSPRNIYRFKKYVTDSPAVLFEEATPVILL